MHRVCVSGGGGVGSRRPAWASPLQRKIAKGPGLTRSPGRFYSAQYQQLLSSSRLPWKGNGRDRTQGQKRMEPGKGRAEASKTTASPSPRGPESAKVAGLPRLPARRYRGAGGAPHVTRAPRGESAGTPSRTGQPPPLWTPFKGLQILILSRDPKSLTSRP